MAVVLLLSIARGGDMPEDAHGTSTRTLASIGDWTAAAAAPDLHEGMVIVVTLCIRRTL